MVISTLRMLSSYVNDFIVRGEPEMDGCSWQFLVVSASGGVHEIPVDIRHMLGVCRQSASRQPWICKPIHANRPSESQASPLFRRGAILKLSVYE